MDDSPPPLTPMLCSPSSTVPSAPSALLRAPVTLRCGHSLCSSHLYTPDIPSPPRPLQTLPPTAFSRPPPVDVTANKLLDLLLAAAAERESTPPLHRDTDEDTASERDVDSDPELEYLPLSPAPPSPGVGAVAPPAAPSEPLDDEHHRPHPPPADGPPPPRRRARTSQSDPRHHPRKRRRRIHSRASPTPSRSEHHPNDHDRRPGLEKQLLLELTCEICFGLFWQPLTTPCQHTLPGYVYFQQHPYNKTILSILLKAFPDAYTERGAMVEAEERDSRLDTPIFICQLSFPGMPTILHFFEPRYRLMLRRCLESENPCFGMIPPPRAAPTATANGSSTGNDYGTMLAIRQVQMFPDGRSIVETWGTWRFRIMDRGMRDGYTVARVERIEDYEDLDPGGNTPPDRRELMKTLSKLRYVPSWGTSTLAPAHPRVILLGSLPPPPSPLPRDYCPLPPPVIIQCQCQACGSGSGGLQDADAPSSRRAPTNAELMATCHTFIEQTRQGTPWVVQHLNNLNYMPMPTDPASFSFWMALLLPIDDHEKAKLLPIRSPRLRLRLVVHWIEQLNSQW
ncbi:PUA-like domain-containing protein [Epithele typhae]|uniref:PUA-like domain-containing protein n=1 Tax=Epithele typhae TaxID=378194 RepID=UPI0020076283|nr:PUA-like domain-containing protein [Epithele typhae]KAH9943399.1 PUA-like domain-containing protein [Epithele typhae]